jgi:magnesium-transporting ATPase (P-type)
MSFREIGIKVWMLTGDHPFTAVSIAHSCGLIEESYSVKIISSPNYADINKILITVIDEEIKNKICLVITGDALSIIQKPSGVGLMNLFLIAIKKSVCVICSRVSPKQKAELVLLVKNQNPEKTTLAVGDGANDVNMINAADVGVGIMGNEGQQAARASDYVIGQFSFLKRLMFVHGREAYRKNSFAVGYILWKNFLYVTPCIM